MDTQASYQLCPVGIVRSPIKRRADAPRSGSAGGPVAQVQIYLPFLPALEGIAVGQEIIILTWLHEARRETLQVHRRSNPANPLAGVFATRSPDRPNPIGLHRVMVLSLEASGLLTVEGLEAIDGTPVVDIKPAQGGTRGA
jgi:tRNA-Thr(GGU) m(6)t(6)A37 methyltransferase TsaA